MICIVIPVKNEATNIKSVLDNCKDLPVDMIIPVLNGCTDDTENIIFNHSLRKKNKIRLLKFIASLGIDTPRAIGAAYAYKHHCQTVIFLDGDIAGDISSNLLDLMKELNSNHIDMALTNCYPYISYRAPMVRSVLSFRGKLNRSLGVFDKLGLSLPSHGPHGLSRRCLDIMPWNFIAIPPLSLAFAAKAKLNISVATSIEHHLLFSAPRSMVHNLQVAETIIGDCLEAISYYNGEGHNRIYKDHNYLGYHTKRRFDLLEEYVDTLGYSRKS